MKASDLRIGNYIFDEENEIGLIKKIDSENKFIYKDEEIVGSVSLDYGDWRGSVGKWIGRCKPMPITEEWLFKFGFFKTEKEIFEKGNLLVVEFIDKWIIGKYDFDDMFSGIANCDYVHQLQNIFFAITGDELQIK